MLALASEIKASVDRDRLLDEVSELHEWFLEEMMALSRRAIDLEDRLLSREGSSSPSIGGALRLTVLLVEVPFDELVRRLRTRLICSSCGTGAEPGQSESDRCKKCGGALVHRIDDGEDVVTRRLIVYKEETEQLVGYYQNSPTFYRINGFQPPAEVTARIRAALEASQQEAARIGARVGSVDVRQ